VLALFTMSLPPSETVPVSTEARGKAREFIRRAYAEDEVRVALLRSFIRDIQQRRDRRPGRRLRPDMLQDILRRWEAGPRAFRLRFEVEWKGRNLSAIPADIGSPVRPSPQGPASAAASCLPGLVDRLIWSSAWASTPSRSPTSLKAAGPARKGRG
jgi:hypothetical protein